MNKYPETPKQALCSTMTAFGLGILIATALLFPHKILWISLMPVVFGIGFFFWRKPC